MNLGGSAGARKGGINHGFIGRTVLVGVDVESYQLGAVGDGLGQCLGPCVTNGVEGEGELLQIGAARNGIGHCIGSRVTD